MSAAERWLADFEEALRDPDDASLAKLFRTDAHWRDLLAFTWQVQDVSGAGKIVRELKRYAEQTGPSGFAVDPGRTPPAPLPARARMRSKRFSVSTRR